MRLIDADALKQKRFTHVVQYWDGKLIGSKSIDDLTTIEAEPVKRGRWIVRGQEVFCSYCNSESGYNAFGASSFSDHCPNCGAKMLEGDEEC